MKSHYGYDQLLKAIHVLTQEGPRKNRLVDAVTLHLELINIERDLPVDVHDDYSQFMSEIALIGSGTPEDSIKATVDSFDDAQVNAAINKVVNLFEKFCRYDGHK
ncbi:MAG: hypothetical protein QNI91_10355 [Arenicellales bacterium]|nr:hypothetical protein [Arenicellales bacterium]